MDRFGFRKLVVYQKSIQCAMQVSRLCAKIPRDHMDLRWQMRRAARSVVLNIAEGAGEFSPKEKARLFRIARRSGWETVGAFDLGMYEGFFTSVDTREAEGLLQEVAAILTTMIKKAETRARGQKH